MYINKVEICGVNTTKLPLLSEKEKEELLIKIKDGDKQAFNTFVNGNLRLVLSVIQKFSNRGECADDLFQIGCVGLIKAVKNFDITVGVKFSTYAVPMIIGEVRRYLRDNSPIRVSRSVKDLAYKVLQVKDELTKQNNRDPSLEEIAKKMDMSVKSISYALDAIQDPVSLYDPVFHDGNDQVSVMDQVSDEKSNDEIWTEDIVLKEAIERLQEREKNIIKLRFFQGKTQTEVAEAIGISQAQVSRLEKNAINHMRKFI